jgi:hypothetical protein
MYIKTMMTAGWWWHTPFIPPPKEAEPAMSESETSLVYRVSSRTARATQRNPVSKETKKKKKKKNYILAEYLMLQTSDTEHLRNMFQS